ncbi:MAG: DNA-3-methyladenine glycosylase, partial [uncultured Friedmanniella sp.]
ERHRRPGREAALPLGLEQLRLPALPRHGVGAAGDQCGGTVRASDPRGVPVGAVLAHHPAQAGELPGGLRRLRPPAGGRLRSRRRRAAAGRRGHRAEPGQDRRRHQQRTGGGRPGRRVRRAGLELRRAGPAAAGGHRRRAGSDRRLGGPGPGAQGRRHPLLRAHHGLRPDAGGRSGRRPPGRVLRDDHSAAGHSSV